MELYLLPLIFCGIYLFFSLFCSKRCSNYLFLSLIFYCVLMAGTRFESDFDFENYVDIFKSIPSMEYGFGHLYSVAANLYLEPTFAFFVSLLKVFISDLYIFLVISTVSLLLYFFALKNSTKYPLIAFFIYLGDGFYLREFTQIRFGLAVVFGLLSLISLKNKKIFNQYVYILCACFFHFTAIMLAFANLWIRYIRKSKYIYAISSILFILSLLGVFDGLVEYFSSIGMAPQRILDHVGTNNAESISRISLVASFGILLWVTKIINENDSEFFWVQVYALSFAFLCIFSGFDLMRRIAFYFSVAVYIISSVALDKKKYGFVFLSLVYSLFLFSSRLNILYPYQSWLFG